MPSSFRSLCLQALAVVFTCVAASRALALEANIMLVVNNASAMDSQETARRALILGWGYRVTTISASASQATFDAAMPTTSAIYISETVLSGDVSTKLVNYTCGIVNEEAFLCDEFGMSSTANTFSDNRINVTDNSHYITRTLSTGTQTLFSASQPVRSLAGTLGGFTTLAQKVGSTEPVLAVMERGATLTPSGAAAGRRVYLPWGNTGMDINQLNSTGQTIMKRAIEWVIMPVAQWKLDDASGATAVDAVAARNGTRTGTTWATGRLAGGLSFNGSTDYVTVANNAAFQITNALTITGWVRGNSWPADFNWASPILRKGDANPNNWQLAVVEGRIKLILDDYDAYGIVGSTVLSTNRWHHVAGTWDGTTAKLYLNGVADGSAARAAPIGTDTRDVYLGGRIGATDILDGRLDEVRFYNRALTALEIAELAKAAPVITSWQQTQP